MRVGLIGRGPWGQRLMRNMLALGVVPAWVCGRSDLRFDADAVIIATPADTHYGLAVRAMAEGCNVLVEKPMALSVNECNTMLSFARYAGCVAWVGHTHLYNAMWQRFRRQHHGATRACVSVGGPCPAPVWWDKGSHAMAFCCDLFGTPRAWERREGLLHVIFDNAECDVQVTPWRHMSVWVPYAAYVPALVQPTPIQEMLRAFFTACAAGKPDTRGFDMACRYAPALELMA